MGYENLEFQVTDDVALITLSRPETLNALTPDLMDELRVALEEAESRARAVVLTGQGRGFCSGQNLTGVELSDPDAVRAMAEQHYFPVIEKLRVLGIPSLAAVNGVAAGGGFSLALACDVVFAARSATFIQVFSRIGLVPDIGSTYFLPRVAGRARALGMMLTNEPILAEQAESWGIIWRSVEDERLLDATVAAARKLARGPTRALVATRAAVNASEGNDLRAQLRHEIGMQAEMLAGRDAREGVRAFREGRKPKFVGH